MARIEEEQQELEEKKNNNINFIKLYTYVFKLLLRLMMFILGGRGGLMAV